MACRMLILLLGVLSIPIEADANLIANGGFETGSPSMGPPPTGFGQWRGDKVDYRGAENGITPMEGTRMLRFIYSEYIANGSANASQYWQHIDLSACQEDIDAGRARLSVSAWFNRIAGDAQTDTEFYIQARMRSGTPSSYTQLGGPIARVLSDADTSTWELAEFRDAAVPAGTDFIQIHLVARENVYNDGSSPEFDGHYADDIQAVLTIVPEPAAAVMLMVPLLGLRRRRTV